MSLAEGQKALQTFHEWCDAQGIEYDKEVRLVSRAFRDAPHRRSRDGFSSAVPGVVPPPSAHRRRPRLPPPRPSPRAQALEIRAFVDGSSANQNRYHYAVFARRDIAAGEVVVRSIPKSACLSARTSSCAPQLQAERLGGGLALNIAIMHERSLREKSKWHGYFAVLPHRGERTLPMFWPNAALQTLRGTELAAHVAADVISLREDYDEHVVNGLCVRFPHVFDPSLYAKGFESYLEAASLAASRAFFIGDVFGEALVPVADAFNHRTDAESVRVFGAEGGFDEEESEEESEETSEETSEEESEEENESSDDDVEEKDSDDDEASSSSAELIDPYDAPVSGKLEIHAHVATKAGDELFNTFGSQNNASLLHKYGFCEIDNKHCTVGLDIELVERVLGVKTTRDAAASVGLDLDEEKYFEIAPDGVVEDALLALLARAFRREGEQDDPTSESPEVREALRDVLRLRLEAYGEDATKKKSGAPDTTAPAGGGLVGVRAAETLRAAEIAVLAAALRAVSSGDDSRDERRGVKRVKR
jgi:SET domain-containing protein 6